MFAKVDNSVSIRRTLKKLRTTQLPLDEIHDCCVTATAPSNVPSNPHDNRNQHANETSGHPYHEFLSVIDTAEKSDKLKYFADVDR